MEHVRRVYDAIAHQWHGTRYKPWPRVAEFIATLPLRATVCDVGCGNGKNMPACNGDDDAEGGAPPICEGGTSTERASSSSSSSAMAGLIRSVKKVGISSGLPRSA